VQIQPLLTHLALHGILPVAGFVIQRDWCQMHWPLYRLLGRIPLPFARSP